jgi:hypothetical protein
MMVLHLAFVQEAESPTHSQSLEQEMRIRNTHEENIGIQRNKVAPEQQKKLRHVNT